MNVFQKSHDNAGNVCNRLENNLIYIYIYRIETIWGESGDLRKLGNIKINHSIESDLFFSLLLYILHSKNMAFTKYVNQFWL